MTNRPGSRRPGYDTPRGPTRGTEDRTKAGYEAPPEPPQGMPPIPPGMQTADPVDDD